MSLKTRIEQLEQSTAGAGYGALAAFIIHCEGSSPDEAECLARELAKERTPILAHEQSLGLLR